MFCRGVCRGIQPPNVFLVSKHGERSFWYAVTQCDPVIRSLKMVRNWRTTSPVPSEISPSDVWWPEGTGSKCLYTLHPRRNTPTSQCLKMLCWMYWPFSDTPLWPLKVTGIPSDTNADQPCMMYLLAWKRHFSATNGLVNTQIRN